MVALVCFIKRCARVVKLFFNLLRFLVDLHVFPKCIECNFCLYRSLNHQNNKQKTKDGV